MSLTEEKKSRRSMTLLIAIFVIPVVLAKLALTFHWFDYGVTNKGLLVNDELTLVKLGLGDQLTEKNWLILYANIDACEEHCEQVLQSIMNTYTALGREMPRVKPILITPSGFDNKSTHTALDFKALQWLKMPKKMPQYLQFSQVLIVDPLGNVVLSHQPPEDSKQLPFFGKEILVDIKKLLKYSRIG